MGNPVHYHLMSVRTGANFDDTGWMLDPPAETEPTLIRAVYKNRQLELNEKAGGLYRFADWLPVNRFLEGSSAPVTWKSVGLASHLKLDNLWITFSGFWPEKGALMRTCSFKETEAYSVCGRLDPASGKILVVASAGNTARAFARVCSDNRIPLLLCMPLDTLDAIWFDEPVDPCVKLVVTGSGSDYFDAIRLSNLACALDIFLPEGGAKNVARRDGMGTTVLSAVTAMGEIPSCYFQAVGSGTGAIAAWEANLRLINDGRFGDRKMKLMLSQNTPFTPMADAWRKGSREISIPDDATARKQVAEIMATVLSNRKPPYGITGGLFDAMKDAGGDFLNVNNSELMDASALFELSEGIDIHPAAAVAVASLKMSVEKGMISRTEPVMINITGGGEALMKNGRKLYSIQPSVIFGTTPSQEEVTASLAALFRGA
jgi:cysteate synthase